MTEKGIELANQKLKRMQERLAFLDNLGQAMEHGEQCKVEEKIISRLPEKRYWIQPFTGKEDFHTAALRLIEEVRSHQLPIGYDIGKLLICEKDRRQKYICVNIRTVEESGHFPQIITIPAGNISVRKSTRVRLMKLSKYLPRS